MQRPGSRPLEDVVENWDLLVDAFSLRHLIIHGAQGTAGVNYAAVRVERMLAASVNVAKYAKENGANVFSRLMRPRARATEGVTPKRKTRPRPEASLGIGSIGFF